MFVARYFNLKKDETYLRLKQRTFEKNQSLPFELVYELAKRYTKVVFHLALLILQQSGQAFMESLQYLDVGKVPM